MIHGLLSKYCRHCYREEDCVAEVQKLHRGMVNMEHCPESLKELFCEVSCTLKREMEKIGRNQVANLKLDLR